MDNTGAFDGITYTDAMTPSATREDGISQPDNAFRVYIASKQLAEQAGFEFAKESPGVKLATRKSRFLVTLIVFAEKKNYPLQSTHPSSTAPPLEGSLLPQVSQV